MDVYVAYYCDINGEDFNLIGVSRTLDGGMKLAERWAHQNGIHPNYATWTIDQSGDWTRYEIFVRRFYMPVGDTP